MAPLPPGVWALLPHLPTSVGRLRPWLAFYYLMSTRVSSRARLASWLLSYRGAAAGSWGWTGSTPTQERYLSRSFCTSRKVYDSCDRPIPWFTLCKSYFSGNKVFVILLNLFEMYHYDTLLARHFRRALG